MAILTILPLVLPPFLTMVMLPLFILFILSPLKNLLLVLGVVAPQVVDFALNSVKPVQ
jgi:hypothetical protein